MVKHFLTNKQTNNDNSGDVLVDDNQQSDGDRYGPGEEPERQVHTSTRLDP